jgi:hypothetical protein
MQKTGILLAVLALVIASTFDLLAGTLADVTLPDTVQVGGRTLVLNGLGLRKKFVVKVYVAGLYLEQKFLRPQRHPQSRRTQADRHAVCAQRK